MKFNFTIEAEDEVQDLGIVKGKGNLGFVLSDIDLDCFHQITADVSARYLGDLVAGAFQDLKKNREALEAEKKEKEAAAKKKKESATKKAAAEKDKKE